jgi:hypothetical protein
MENPTKQIADIKNVSCTVNFKGTVPKEQFYSILEILDSMKKIGFVFEKHDRTYDMDTETTHIDYELVLIKNVTGEKTSEVDPVRKELSKKKAYNLMKKGRFISNKKYREGEYLYMIGKVIVDENHNHLGTKKDNFWKNHQPFKKGWLSSKDISKLSNLK